MNSQNADPGSMRHHCWNWINSDPDAPISTAMNKKLAHCLGSLRSQVAPTNRANMSAAKNKLLIKARSSKKRIDYSKKDSC